VVLNLFFWIFHHLVQDTDYTCSQDHNAWKG